MLTCKRTKQVNTSFPLRSYGGENFCDKQGLDSENIYSDENFKYTQICGGNFGGKSCAKTILVHVYPKDCPQKYVRMYAVIDDHSNRTLAKPELVDLMDTHETTTNYLHLFLEKFKDQQLSHGWTIIGETCLGKTHKPDVINIMKTCVLPDGRPTLMLPCNNNLQVKEKNISEISTNMCTKTEIGENVFQKTKSDEKLGLSMDDHDQSLLTILSF